jgi:ribosome maturation factor RimP
MYKVGIWGGYPFVKKRRKSTIIQEIFGRVGILYTFAADLKQLGGGRSPPPSVIQKDMIERELVTQLAKEGLASTDIFLVDVMMGLENLIRVEIDSNRALSIDDCAALNRFLVSHLDKEAEDYELEVTSAGINSPFKIVPQYVKHIGEEVEMALKKGVKLKGILKAADGLGVVITVEKQVKPEGAKRKTTEQKDFSYTYEEIKYTKYIIHIK